MRPIFGQSIFRQPNELTQVKIEAVDDGFAIHSPYNPAFVAALKSRITGADRKWDANRKVWIVAHNQGATAIDLIASYYNQTVSLPNLTGRAPLNAMQLLDVRYIGAAKSRDDGSETSYGWSKGGWSVIFPKAVLLEWFGQTARPDEAQTLYGVLGVSQSAQPFEIKIAWRRMARSYHPDVCKEPGATEQFHLVQAAYEVLSDQMKRAKYNAGLQFEAMSKAHTPRHTVSQNNYHSPLRCGLILVEGQSRLGRFVVSKILAWQDILNGRGETLVTTWKAGEDMFTEAWIP
jgi:hypothetical protein